MGCTQSKATATEAQSAPPEIEEEEVDVGTEQTTGTSENEPQVDATGETRETTVPLADPTPDSEVVSADQVKVEKDESVADTASEAESIEHESKDPTTVNSLTLDLREEDNTPFNWVELSLNGELLYFNPASQTCTASKPDEFCETDLIADSEESKCLKWIGFPVFEKVSSSDNGNAQTTPQDGEGEAEDSVGSQTKLHFYSTIDGNVVTSKPDDYVGPKQGTLAARVVTKFLEAYPSEVSNTDELNDTSDDGSTKENTDTPVQVGPPSPDSTPRSVSDLRAKFSNGEFFSPSQSKLNQVKEERRKSFGDEILNEERRGSLNEKIEMLKKSGVERPEGMDTPKTPLSQVTMQEIHSDISKGSVKEKSKNFKPEYSPMKVQVIDEIRLAEMQEEVAHRKSSAAMKDYWATVEEINNNVVTRKEF